MKIKHLIVPLLFAVGNIFSQTPCTTETAYQTVGKWGTQKKDAVFEADPTFPKEQYKPVLAKAQKVVDLFKLANPEFKGIEASAQRAIQGESYLPNGALPFRLTVFYGSYSCIPMDNNIVAIRGKVILIGQYGSTFVYFNSFGNLLDKALLTVGDRQIYWFRKQLGDFKGFTMIQPGEGSGPKHEALIITPDKRLPYIPVTREQYLRALQEASRKRAKETQGVASQMDADVAKMIAKIDADPNLSPQLKEQIKASLAANAKQHAVSIPKAASADTDKVAKIEAELARMSATERQSPAVVGDMSGWEGVGKLFATDAEGGYHLVTIDKSFFDPGLPRDAIQFIAVDWNWNEQAPPQIEAIRQFKQNFDFEALRKMLGK